MRNKLSDADVADKATVDAAVMELQDAMGVLLTPDDLPEDYSFDVGREYESDRQEPISFNEQEWAAEGEKLAKCHEDVKWLLGEWLVKGAKHYGEEDSGGELVAGYRLPVEGSVYTEAHRITGIAKSTLKDLASTARRCPASVRTDALSWSHHRVLVNERPDANKEEMNQKLQEAVEKKYSVAKFRQALRGYKPATREKSFLVTVPLDVWETLKALADEEDTTVAVVAAEWLCNVDEEQETKTRREMAERSTAERRREQRRRVGRRVARSYDPLGLRRER